MGIGHYAFIGALTAKEIGCKPGQLTIVHSQSGCAEILPEQTESTACYIRANLGYFITHSDYMGNINITFNRFD